MENTIEQAVKTTEQKQHYATLRLSIRRRDLEAGLPGDDPTAQNPKIGSSLKGRAPLSGLSLEEEYKYLPEIIGIDPKDTKWRQEVKSYWNNISEPIPHDDVAVNSKIPGRVIEFTVVFNNEKDKIAFEDAKTFDLKAEISKRGDVTIGSVADYILFRYCLVYGKVSNNMEDRYKSNKITFYLYSPENNTKKQYNKFKLKSKARELFASILDDNTMIDAILRLYKKDPDNIMEFDSLESKHIFLDKAIDDAPSTFLNYAKDKFIKGKALILQAVDAGIIYNPPNTELYYLGQDKQEKLGEDLVSAVHFLKSKEPKNQAILDTIKAQLNISK